LERGPHGSDGDSMSRRFLNWNAKELGAGNKSNERSTKEHEEVVQ